MQSGDTCEIFTSKVEGSGPSRDWLQIVQTPRAANKIRQWFSRERREDARETGREDLEKQLRREGLPTQKLPKSVLAEVAVGLNYLDIDALYTAIGEHHVSPEAVVARITRLLRSGDTDREDQLSTTVSKPRAAKATKPGAGVHVEGFDDVMVRLSRCCTPVPPDEIIGFVTRGRGLSVHRADCANAASLRSGQRDRVMEVEWDEDLGEGTFVASIEIRAIDRARLLRDVSSVLADGHVNIISCTMNAGQDRMAVMRFNCELGDPAHLGTVLGAIRRIEGVYESYRVLPGASSN
jgi:GTP pyrophosphokinase